jgi:DNA-binding response OmpR family regulator
LAGRPGSAVNLPQAIDQAIRSVSDEVQSKSVVVVAEYPAHLPMVEGDREEIVGAIARLLKEGLSWVDHNELVVKAELLPAGELPQVRGERAGNTEGLEKGGPWALVRAGWSGKPETGASLRAALTWRAVRENGKVEPASPLQEAAAVVESLGGRLWVEIAPGDVALVTIALPLRAARANVADLSAVRRVVEAHLPGSEEPAPLILVLVEDQRLMDLLAGDLASAGFRVLVSTRGADVLALARSERPNLILLDLLARDPVAFDIAMVLKQDRRTREIPVLFLTSGEDPNLGLRMGAVSFVVRPVGTGALLSTVGAVLKSGLSPSARVLVVEPNDTTRDTLVMMIQNHGYRVTEAAGPEEALVLAERVTPEMVLVNSILAQDRDYWLLRELRNLPFDMGIYVMAEAITEAEGREAIHRGASGFSDTGKLPDLLTQVRESHSWDREAPLKPPTRPLSQEEGEK